MSVPYYSDDAVTLYLGDCRDVTEWLAADVLVTDPPYGISRVQQVGGYRGIGSQMNIYNAVKNDKTTDARDESLRLWGDKPAVMFGSWRAPRPTGTNHRLIWHKAGQAPGPVNLPFQVQDEEIYIIGRGFVSSSPPMRSVIRTTESRSIEVTRVGHPTPKPIGLMELLITRCPAGVIADPFAGSGSTLIAAKRQGRQAIGVEVDERYAEIAATRLAQDVLDFGESA